jgi:hypothetical protein
MAQTGLIMRTVLAAALGLPMVMPVQAAEPVETALKNIGLLGGRWAADCSQLSSPTNWQAFFAGVTVVWLGGLTKLPNVSIVQDARQRPDGTVALRTEQQRDHSVAELVYDMRDDHSAFRPISIHLKRGDEIETVVEDGVFVAGNVKAPWYVHCRPGVP